MTPFCIDPKTALVVLRELLANPNMDCAERTAALDLGIVAIEAMEMQIIGAATKCAVIERTADAYFKATDRKNPLVQPYVPTVPEISKEVFEHMNQLVQLIAKDVRMAAVGSDVFTTFGRQVVEILRQEASHPYFIEETIRVARQLGLEVGKRTATRTPKTRTAAEERVACLRICDEVIRENQDTADSFVAGRRHGANRVKYLINAQDREDSRRTPMVEWRCGKCDWLLGSLPYGKKPTEACSKCGTLPGL